MTTTDIDNYSASDTQSTKISSISTNKLHHGIYPGIIVLDSPSPLDKSLSPLHCPGSPDFGDYSRQYYHQAVLHCTGDSMSSVTPLATTHKPTKGDLSWKTAVRATSPLLVRARTTLLHPLFLARHEYSPAPGKSIIVFVVPCSLCC